MEGDTLNKTGLQCLQILFSQVRRNVNFASLITEQLLNEYQQNASDVILKLAEKQELAPEVYTDKDTDTKLLREYYKSIKNK